MRCVSCVPDVILYHIHTYMHTHKACIHTCTHIYAHTHTNTHMYALMHTCMHTHVHTHRWAWLINNLANTSTAIEFLPSLDSMYYEFSSCRLAQFLLFCSETHYFCVIHIFLDDDLTVDFLVKSVWKRRFTFAPKVYN